MDNKSPIFTEKAECRDCHKCLRKCTVKAIKIEGGNASVIPERCISCALCVESCPVKAKKIRNDTARVKELIQMGGAPIASLAPSFPAVFPEWDIEDFALSLKELGFSGVSETALGAELVSSVIAERFENMASGLLISPACPVVVELIYKYYPHFAENVVDIFSPMLSHAKMLKKAFGATKQIVFIGPCAAKKKEADSHPDLIYAALTFENLLKWMEEENIYPFADFAEKKNQSAIMTSRAFEGRLYPIDGGMITTIKNSCRVCDEEMLTISGLEAVEKALDELEPSKLKGKLFLELLACPGGCVNGPAAILKNSTVLKRNSVISFKNTRINPAQIVTLRPVNISIRRKLPGFEIKTYDTAEILSVMQSIGKLSPKDELNCDGCGHRDCRSFAIAVLDGRAEREMCVTYMKRLAMKKANALIKTIPSGVLIIDNELKIIEANRRFAEIIGEKFLDVFETRGGFEGIELEKICPFLTPPVSYVLNSGNEISSKIIKTSDNSFRVSAFNIENQKVIGVVINNLNEKLFRDEELIRQANELIKKNLAATQQIAFLLGENASETHSCLANIVKLLSDIREK